MAVTTDRELRQILTMSAAMRQTEIQDLVYNSNPVLAILREKGMIRPYYGAEIRVPLEIDKIAAQWFTGYDKLRIEPKELINSAVFTPKNVFAGFSLTGTELLANQGKGQIIDLVSHYLRSAENSVRDEMEIALHSDGTGDGGRSLIGFGGALPIVATAGTYGGIDRGQHAIWRTASYSVTGGDFADIGSVWDSSTARPIIERITLARSKGRQYPDLIIADAKAYAAISASMVAHLRVRSERMGRLGFEAISIVTPAGVVDVVAAAGVGTVMPENTIYGIDTKSLALFYHPQRNFVPSHDGDGAKPINQDAVAQGIMWNGELVMSNPRFMYRLRTA